MARACRVERNMCGWTMTALMPVGTGIVFTRGCSMPTVSTSPPNSEGEMLSTCSEPLATASPCIANFSSSSLLTGLASSALAATTAPTADAAEPPRPEPSGMPFSISISKPKPGCNASSRAMSALPAVFFCGSSGRSSTTPRVARIETPGLIPPPHRHLVAQRIDGEAEDVEADGDVADRGRRKGGCRGDHSLAPRYVARRSRSANTPPAVTSVPAPGPCTISGLLQ